MAPCRGQKVGSKDAADVNISPAMPGSSTARKKVRYLGSSSPITLTNFFATFEKAQRRHNIKTEN